jgi:hypothetical protein
MGGATPDGDQEAGPNASAAISRRLAGTGDGSSLAGGEAAAVLHGPLRQSDVTELQQTAGDKAAVTAVQRDTLLVQRDGPIPWKVAELRQLRERHAALTAPAPARP